MVIALTQSSSGVLTLPRRENFPQPQSNEQMLVEHVFGLLFGEQKNTPLDQLLYAANNAGQSNAVIIDSMPLPANVRTKADLNSQALLLLWEAIEQRDWKPKIEQHASPSTKNPKFLVIQSRLIAQRDNVQAEGE